MYSHSPLRWPHPKTEGRKEKDSFKHFSLTCFCPEWLQESVIVFFCKTPSHSAFPHAFIEQQSDSTPCSEECLKAITSCMRVSFMQKSCKSITEQNMNHCTLRKSCHSKQSCPQQLSQRGGIRSAVQDDKEHRNKPLKWPNRGVIPYHPKSNSVCYFTLILQICWLCSNNINDHK